LAFAKGLGVAAPSLVIYRLGGACTTFSATAGVDDSANGNGSVVFQVWGDDTLLYDSGPVTGATEAKTINADVTGKRRLRLLVTNAGDGSSLDRASWADAKVECAP
jgi:alpha-galactosidase